ncbi:MAG: hypothetical protein Q4A15_03575 [Prevotellaceae bacterium]|nr:hypothetical protein [Prevotellaceae bacterium]
MDYIDKTWVIVFIVIVVILLIGIAIGEPNVKHIRTISGYELVELEDGHQYLRVHAYHGRTLEHYVDCPKCKNK